MAKLFVHLEFTRKNRFTTPVSLGAITEDGAAQFYAEFTDFDRSQVDDWLERHVMSARTLVDEPEGYQHVAGGTTEIKGTVPFVVKSEGGLAAWIESLHDSDLTFTSFGLSYDHVLFIDLFLIAGVALPSFLGRYTLCVSTMLQLYGMDPNVAGVKAEYARQSGLRKHNALIDARGARDIYLRLRREYVVVARADAR